MARPIEEFIFVWESLAGKSDEKGWRCIPVTSVASCKLMVARRFPENEESLLVHFPSTKVPVGEKLPEGKGFTIDRVDPHGDGKSWLALTRKESGSFELFSAMVCDVIGAMEVEATSGEEKLLRIFLGRVRAWQDFMRKGNRALEFEAELGLIGELSFLATMLESGVPALSSVEAWVGPLDGIQDFEIGTGAVEVKATSSTLGFLAKIGSLEQLDDSIRQPLFVAGVRLLQVETGKNLPEFVETLRQMLKDNIEAENIFSERILAAGYFINHVEQYLRRFSLVDIRIIEVTDVFPRIVRGMVLSGINRVVYEIDLDKASGNNLKPEGVFKILGVI